MGPLGFTEIMFILVLALLLFGPRRLPELGRMLGKGLMEFRRASSDLRSTIEEEVRALEQATEPGKKISPPHTTPRASVPSEKPDSSEPPSAS